MHDMLDCFSKKKNVSKSINLKGRIPFPMPRGLNDALGWTVLVESIKLSEAQNIPDKTLVSSFQVPSTLKRDKRSFFSGKDVKLILPVSPASSRDPYSLCHRVLEPHPELSTRRGWLVGLSPLHGPPVPLREGDVQLSHWELWDDLAQGLGEKAVVGHWKQHNRVWSCRRENR